LSTLLAQIRQVRQHESEIASWIQGSVSGDAFSSSSSSVLGDCPMCKQGKMIVIRSHKSGKRFVGCTNYGKGCRASAPLPQKGAIKTASKPCGSCGWPVVYVRLGRYPWRLCVNNRCPRKVNVYAMTDSSKGRGKAERHGWKRRGGST
jgi:ssDNA-binding Zn-finger/Zn-ribbon topoisomerase 1